MIVLRIRNRLRPNYDTRQPAQFCRVQREGLSFDLEGETIELFGVGTLAEALDRKRETILAWERTGLILAPLFRVQGKLGRRFYSATQIMNANNIFMHRYKGRKYTHGSTLLNRLLQDLKVMWYESEIVAVDTYEPTGKEPAVGYPASIASAE